MKSFKELYARSREDADFLAEQLKVSFLAGLTHRMQEQGVSKSELARRTGTTPAYITKIFSGPTNVSAQTMAKLAFALNAKVKVDFEDLPLQKIEVDCRGLRPRNDVTRVIASAYPSIASEAKQSKLSRAVS
jgi:transcriptional regulator with XRE-family HTH domain